MLREASGHGEPIVLTETWPVHMAPKALGGGNPDAEPWQFTMTSRFQREAKSAFREALRAVV